MKINMAVFYEYFPSTYLINSIEEFISLLKFTLSANTVDSQSVEASSRLPPEAIHVLTELTNVEIASSQLKRNPFTVDQYALSQYAQPNHEMASSQIEAATSTFSNVQAKPNAETPQISRRTPNARTPNENARTPYSRTPNAHHLYFLLDRLFRIQAGEKCNKRLNFE